MSLSKFSKPRMITTDSYSFSHFDDGIWMAKYVWDPNISIQCELNAEFHHGFLATDKS